MRQHSMMTQARTYDYEVALCDEEYDDAYDELPAEEGYDSARPRVYYEPDEDFYRSLSAEEFRERLIVILEEVDKRYAKKCR